MNSPAYFVSGRQSGKTAKILQWVEAQDDIEKIAVLCQSEKEVDRASRSWNNVVCTGKKRISLWCRNKNRPRQPACIPDPLLRIPGRYGHN